MKTIKVVITTDEDVIQKYSIRNPAQIEFYVVIYLNDPDGWSRKGYFFMPVASHGDVSIRLSSPETIEKKCGANWPVEPEPDALPPEVAAWALVAIVAVVVSVGIGGGGGHDGPEDEAIVMRKRISGSH